MKTQEVLSYFSYLLGHVKNVLAFIAPLPPVGFGYGSDPPLSGRFYEKSVTVKGANLESYQECTPFLTNKFGIMR
jgi:hypothetical protein